MIDQCVIETVEGGFPEVNKYVHASCLGPPKRGLPEVPVLGCARKLGSKVRISGFYPQYTLYISWL